MVRKTTRRRSSVSKPARKPTHHHGRVSAHRAHKVGGEHPGDYVTLKVEDLKVAQDSYQRGVVRAAKAIAADFDWMSFGAVTVSLRGGEYWIIDGQQRVEAAKILGITEVPCILFPLNSVREEAGIFSRINVNRTGLTSVRKFLALCEANDALALEIKADVERMGFTIAEGTGKTVYRAVSTLLRSYQADKERAQRVLMIHLNLALTANVQPDDTLYKGLFRLENEVKKMNPEWSLVDKAWLNKLRQIGAVKLKQACLEASSYWGKSSPTVWAGGISVQMNKNSRNRRKVPNPMLTE